MFNTEGASCIGIEPEFYFPTNNMNPELERILKRTCMGCPIFDDCLNYALNVKVHGYWAGTTSTMRVELRRFFGITAVRIDQQYKDLMDTPTSKAINKRNSRQAQKEAG